MNRSIILFIIGLFLGATATVPAKSAHNTEIFIYEQATIKYSLLSYNRSVHLVSPAV